MVAAILVVLAGLALGRLGGLDEHARRTATLATMAAVREAIVGAPGRPGYMQDTGRLPLSLGDLFRTPPHLPPSLAQFDPISGRGWNGPYLDPSKAVRAEGGIANPTKEPPLLVLDGWRRPLVLQNPTPDGRFARLVSAGPDGAIDTSPIAGPVDPNDPSEVGDDLVLFLTYVPGTGG